MSYKFPRWRMASGEVVELDDLNQDLEDIVGEAAGRLNEHNFAAGAFTDGDPSGDVQYMDHDTGIRLYQGWTHDGTAIDQIGVNAATAFSVALPLDSDWVTLQATSSDVLSPGAMLLMIGSLQSCSSAVAAPGDPTGSLFALRIDGQLIVETVTGSMEQAQDVDRSWLTAETSVPAISIYKQPIVVQCIVPVPPGRHVVELVGCSFPNYAAAAYTPVVESRELIVVELINCRA